MASGRCFFCGAELLTRYLTRVPVFELPGTTPPPAAGAEWLEARYNHRAELACRSRSACDRRRQREYRRAA